LFDAPVCSSTAWPAGQPFKAVWILLVSKSVSLAGGKPAGPALNCAVNCAQTGGKTGSITERVS
jgi:hypothetical protein